MGEAQGTLFAPQFNRSIKIQTSEQKFTSHAGAVLLREVDHQLGLVESLAERLADPRDAKKIRYTAIELLRERIYALALGSENQADLDRLAHDPAMRMATWDRPGGSYNGYYRDTVYHPLPRQLLCTRRLRQHPRRPPLGQRLHPCDAQARTSSHGSRCAAVHEACGPTCSSDSAEF